VFDGWFEKLLPTAEVEDDHLVLVFQHEHIEAVRGPCFGRGKYYKPMRCKLSLEPEEKNVIAHRLPEVLDRGSNEDLLLRAFVAVIADRARLNLVLDFPIGNIRAAFVYVDSVTAYNKRARSLFHLAQRISRHGHPLDWWELVHMAQIPSFRFHLASRGEEGAGAFYAVTCIVRP
jgi:hypothetical protein